MVERDPTQLALICRLADRWQAPGCLRLAFEALADLPAAQLAAEAAARVLQLLPECTQQQPKHAQLQSLCFTVLSITTGPTIQPLLLALLGDVHLVLTTPALIGQLQQLPVAAMRLWLGSDDLVVDSENSVLVALDCWVRGAHGSSATSAQLKELSGLVRVAHLTPDYQQRLCSKFR